MLHTRDEFYLEVYHPNFHHIIQLAIETYPDLAIVTLNDATNRWLRNVGAYNCERQEREGDISMYIHTCMHIHERVAYLDCL